MSPKATLLHDERAALATLWVLPALFASNNVAARLAEGHVSPFALAFWRWAITFGVLLPLVARGLARNAHIIQSEAGKLFVMGLLGMAVASLGTYLGALTTTAGNIGLIYASTPGLILLLDRLLTGTQLGLPQVLGMISCVFGMIFIVVRGDLQALITIDVRPGDWWAAAGAFGWAAYSVLLKYWPSKLALRERATMTSLAGLLIIAPFYFGEALLFDPPDFSQRSLAIILVVGFFAGVLVLLLHAYVTSVLGPRRALVLLYLIPLYNLALAWLILGEQLYLYQMGGAALILLGIYFSGRAKPADNIPESQSPRI